MDKKSFKGRDLLILSLTFAVIVGLAVFCIRNRQLIAALFNYIMTGRELVQEYVQGFGIPGQVAIAVVIGFCFFFPFVSSLPLQILCVMAYGVWHATLLISLAIALASQLLFLIERVFQVFCYSEKQKKKQEEIEQYIQNSNRNIHAVMILLYIVPCIPFLVISSVACRSNMRWSRYTLYTAQGPIPEVFVTLVLGNRLTTNSTPVVSFLILLFMIALVVLSLIFKDQLIYFIFKPRNKKKEDVL